MTGRKKTARIDSETKGQDQLDELETALAAFMEASVDVLVLFDRNLNLLGMNPAGERLIGLKKETSRAIIGKNLLDILPYVAQSGRYEKYLDVLRTGEPLIADDVIVHPTLGSIHLSVKAFRAGDGLGIIASDITERKRMEKALAESEERYRALVDTAGKAGLGIEIVQNVGDREAVIVFANDEYCRMMGYSREELLGMSEWDLVSPADLSMVQDRYRRRQKGENVISLYEIRMLRKNGTELPIETSVRTMTYQGKIATVSYFRDITERKRAEEELRKARDELELRVKERTQELASANEALRREIMERKRVEEKLQELYLQERTVRQQLEDEMRRRVEFTRALAHELKTPLTPMLISSQALEAELKDELLLGLATNIRRGALNLNSRIDELLDMAKGEIGMLRLKLEPTDVLQLLREVVDYVSPVAIDRGQKIVTELPLSLPVIKADEVRLRQVVLNLLNNALKFTQEGGTITLRASQKRDSLVVEIEDNGPGIDEEAQKHLFEPYHRMEAKVERLSGLGLGLALCKTLVELHGGRIWASSRQGKGAIFSFSIPVIDPHGLPSSETQ